MTKCDTMGRGVNFTLNCVTSFVDGPNIVFHKDTHVLVFFRYSLTTVRAFSFQSSLIQSDISIAKLKQKCYQGTLQI